MAEKLQLGRRATMPELMDDDSAQGEPLREAFRHLRRLNRLFAASAPVLYGVKRLWVEAGRPARLSVLDIGCGSGDVNRALLKWAKREGIELRLILADVTEEACAEARSLFRDEPHVTVRRLDLFALPEAGADIVTASQVLHHFDEEKAVEAAASMLQGARIGCAIGDIHRHPIAWAAVWAAARLVSRNRYIRHDGPLSVAKGFRASDWLRMRERLVQDDAAAEVRYAWRPLFRYACWAVRGSGGSGKTEQ